MNNLPPTPPAPSLSPHLCHSLSLYLSSLHSILTRQNGSFFHVLLPLHGSSEFLHPAPADAARNGKARYLPYLEATGPLPKVVYLG